MPTNSSMLPHHCFNTVFSKTGTLTLHPFIPKFDVISNRIHLSQPVISFPVANQMSINLPIYSKIFSKIPILPGSPMVLGTI